MEILTISIGIGLVVSLAFSEVLGLAAGGMIVPGYIALYLDQPIPVALTIMTAGITFFTVKLLSSFLIIYGRRRTVITLITGFIFGIILNYIIAAYFPSSDLGTGVIGYLIPGLIAIWMDRQGAMETISTLITSSVIVRLLLIVITGGSMAL